MAEDLGHGRHCLVVGSGRLTKPGNPTHHVGSCGGDRNEDLSDPLLRYQALQVKAGTEDANALHKQAFVLSIVYEAADIIREVGVLPCLLQQKHAGIPGSVNQCSRAIFVCSPSSPLKAKASTDPHALCEKNAYRQVDERYGDGERSRTEEYEDGSGCCRSRNI